MRIEYLREYIELVHCLNFSKAAQLLNTTQSTISKHVLALEEECRADLFVREGAQIALTDEGRALFEGALRIIEEHDRLIEQVRSLGKQRASLSVGGLYHNAEIIALVAASLAEVKRAHPHASISYREFPQESFLDIVKEGKADLVFTMLEDPEGIDPALVAVHLFDDPLVAIVRADHEVAQRGSIEIEDLAEWTVLHPAGSYSIVGADIAKGICKRHGVTPQHRVVFLQSILDFPTIEIGDDLLVIERSLAHSQVLQEGYTVVPFSSRDAVFPFYAAYRGDNENPLLAPFIEGLVSRTE
jgi:DNA-binding transcriptional LysR family regulator